MKHWLWGIAERADFANVPPRRFWSWLLRRMDRMHGYHFNYDD